MIENSPYLMAQLLRLYHLPRVGPVWWHNVLLPKMEQLGCLSPPELYHYIQPCLPLESRGIAFNEVAVSRDLKWAEQSNHHIVGLMPVSASYPPILSSIYSAPPLLYIKGNLDILSSPQVAIVGSREPSPYGRVQGFKFSFELAKRGWTITSGLAIGVDATAHEGALQAQGKTIAVLAHGLDTLYPACHRSLAQSILDGGGALVSEFSIGTKPQKHFFPRRNRIISGLSLGTLIVEAKIKSGTLISAQYAIDQGREVFAIPGQIDNELSGGTNKLIKDGAHLVESCEDVISILEMANGGLANFGKKVTYG